MFTELLTDLRYRLRALFQRDALERELDEELRLHLQLEADKLTRLGVERGEAMRRSRIAFGGLDRIKQDSRERRGIWALEVLANDVRYALRGLRAKPIFTIGVVLTLSLGLGANVAMFGVIDRLMFRSPAYLHDAARVHRVYLSHLEDGREQTAAHFEYTRYLDLTRWTSSFDRSAAFAGRQLAIGTGDDARELPIAAVSASFFELFDARPLLGRFFAASEDSLPMGASVVVLGHAFWQTRYGGRRNVIGTALRIGPMQFTVIGVAPEGFVGVESGEAPAAFIPITTYAGATQQARGEPIASYYTRYDWGWMEMLARRKPGVSHEAASADLTNAYRRSWQVEHPAGTRGPTADSARARAAVGPVQPGRGPMVGSTEQVATWLAGVAVIVLLIACANVANLLLARALARRREIAVRLALGVSRARLLAQLVAESTLLALLGGAGGLVVAELGGVLLRRFFLPQTEWLGAVGDPRTMVFVGVLTLLVGVATGLAPAVSAGRDDLTTTLKAGAREGTYHRSRLRTVLLVFQGALSVVLLVGAGLFVRSLANVRAVRLGFDVDPVLYVFGNLRGERLSPSEQVALRHRLLDEARTIPGVVHATRAVSVPFWDSESRGFFVPGFDSASWKMGHFTLQAGSAEYFETMGTRILRGRGFSSEDRAGAPPVVVVSDAMARRLWPGKDALGQCIKMKADTMPCTTVIGVAEAIKQSSLTTDAGLNYYLPIEQFDSTTGGLFLRTSGDAVSQVETVRRRLQRVMPGASYVRVTPMHDIVDPTETAWQLGATMFLAFGTLALVLAAIGLYSVIAYDVAQRTRDLGVRIALGARVLDVLGLVVGDAVRFAASGAVIGGAIALAGSGWMASLLFAESPRDPIVYGAVVAVLVAVAIVASLVPALRAARVDPTVALRGD